MENYFDTPDVLTPQSLALFQTNKEQRTSFVNNIIDSLDKGEANPLEVLLQAKGLEDILTQLTSTDAKKNKNVGAAERFKEFVLDAFKTQGDGQKSFDFHNAKFTKMEAGTKYHYENCNDPVLIDLYSRRDDLLDKIKKREAFLQTVPPDGVEIRHEDELVMIYPPYKTSTTTISVSLK